MAVEPAGTRGDIEHLRTDPDLPPVGVVDRTPISPTARVVFLVLAILGFRAWRTALEEDPAWSPA